MENQEEYMTIHKVIHDHFAEDENVYEAALYAISSLAVNDAIMAGTMSKSKKVNGIPADAFALMRKYDNGLTTNKFWLENFAPIRMQMAMADIKLNTHKHYILFSESKIQEGNSEKEVRMALQSARSILLSRLDVLTVIAFLWKGVDFAEEFDAKFRMAFQLVKEHEQYFSDRGI